MLKPMRFKKFLTYNVLIINLKPHRFFANQILFSIISFLDRNWGIDT
jgi:hypothetical protein